MTEWHLKSKRTKTGAKRNSIRRSDKKESQKGGFAANTTISKESKSKTTLKKTLGGSTKRALKETSAATVSMPSEKKNVKAKIISVIENKANREFARRNTITKGALLKIEIDGKELTARVTSRPGQSGSVNAIITQDRPEKEAEKAAAKKVKKEAAARGKKK